LGRTEKRSDWRLRIEKACRIIDVDPSFLNLLHPVNRRGTRGVGQERDADPEAASTETSAGSPSPGNKKPRSTSKKMRNTIARYMTGQTML